MTARKNLIGAGLGCSIVLAGAVRDEIKTKRFSALKLKGRKSEKTFYRACRVGLPNTALPMRLIHSFVASQMPD